MPVVADNSTISAEHNRYRRSRYQQQQQQQQPPISESDPNPPQIPSIIQSSRCKPTISSLLVSDGGGGGGGTAKKKNFPSGTFRGLGCTASSQVSVPAVIRTSANWEAKKVMKKQRSLQQKKNKAPNQSVANNNNPSSSSSSSAAATVVVPDVCCGPGFGFATATDAASVECAVPRRPFPGRVKVDGEKMNQRERPSCSTRRMVNPESISFMDSDSEHFFGMSHSGFDVFEARYHRRVRHPSAEGLAEIMMLQSSLLMGGRSDGFDRYRDWRLDVDSMSYEELLELGDRIGYVNTGLKEDEIVHCLRETKLLDNSFSHFPAEMEWKCSICQEDYEPNDEMGKLECGHFYHIHCIKQWLSQKNACPICKTAAASQ